MKESLKLLAEFEPIAVKGKLSQRDPNFWLRCLLFLLPCRFWYLIDQKDRIMLTLKLLMINYQSNRERVIIIIYDHKYLNIARNINASLKYQDASWQYSNVSTVSRTVDLCYNSAKYCLLLGQCKRCKHIYLTKDYVFCKDIHNITRCKGCKQS